MAEGLVLLTRSMAGHLYSQILDDPKHHLLFGSWTLCRSAYNYTMSSNINYQDTLFYGKLRSIHSSPIRITRDITKETSVHVVNKESTPDLLCLLTIVRLIVSYSPGQIV